MTIIARWVLSWLRNNATARIYSSRIPVGSRLGGKDVPELPDLFLILHVEVKGRILVLGWFQTT